MLLALTVRNYTLVEHLEVDFGSGMTAITGETGAGKSLVLDALGMALGDRADPDRIRRGADRAEIAAEFHCPPDSPANAWLRRNDFDHGDFEPVESCLLRRLFTREGRSRGYINGQPATMQQLQQLGDLLIDIHSQHEHQSLLKRDTHRRLLDEFGEHTGLAQQAAERFREWKSAAEKLALLESDADELNHRRELLQFQLEELEQLGLAEGELENLEREQQLLANAEHILRDSHALLALCRDGEEFDLQSALARCLGLLQGMAEKTPPLMEAEGLMESARIQLEEAVGAIQHHVDSFELDPERLQSVEERLSAAYQLARKHRIQPDRLPELQSELAAEFDRMVAGEGNLEHLRDQVTTCERSYLQAAKKLTKARAGAAGKFAAAVNGQLGALAMEGATLEVALKPLEQYSSHGGETVEFLISTNPGQPLNPLSKVASGGELSRLSLAIQVVAAQHSTIPSLVFDEVDVGIGGAVAEVVGRLLRTLGDNGQVICVTHLPQVASCAHHHLVVSKTSGEAHAESGLRKLARDERVREIARMLGGVSITGNTLAHAEEMLTLAADAGA